MIAFGIILGGILIGVFGGFIGAFIRAAVTFFPTMILLGAVHSYIPAVPALGWTATFFVVALLSLLIPTSLSINSSK